ncbi:hypothetical protein C8R42DRAFT_724222 [Lentinula raphanica]|nr:hypothetical protein C8R42DRAFT_724222 [Lentinula raphanica]
MSTVMPMSAPSRIKVIYHNQLSTLTNVLAVEGDFSSMARTKVFMKASDPNGVIDMMLTTTCPLIQVIDKGNIIPAVPAILGSPDSCLHYSAGFTEIHTHTCNPVVNFANLMKSKASAESSSSAGNSTSASTAGSVPAKHGLDNTQSTLNGMDDIFDMVSENIEMAAVNDKQKKARRIPQEIASQLRDSPSSLPDPDNCRAATRRVLFDPVAQPEPVLRLYNFSPPPSPLSHVSSIPSSPSTAMVNTTADTGDSPDPPPPPPAPPFSFPPMFSPEQLQQLQVQLAMAVVMEQTYTQHTAPSAPVPAPPPFVAAGDTPQCESLYSAYPDIEERHILEITR